MSDPLPSQWSERTARVAARRAAVAVVKLVHTAIFLSIAASILHVFYSGLTNRRSRLTSAALTIAVTESVVFAGAGWRCPLRGLAERLGAESGQVTDIFLPRWFANRIHLFFTPPLLIGILALVWNRRRDKRTVH